MPPSKRHQEGQAITGGFSGLAGAFAGTELPHESSGGESFEQLVHERNKLVTSTEKHMSANSPEVVTDPTDTGRAHMEERIRKGEIEEGENVVIAGEDWGFVRRDLASGEIVLSRTVKEGEGKYVDVERSFSLRETADGLVEAERALEREVEEERIARERKAEEENRRAVQGAADAAERRIEGAMNTGVDAEDAVESEERRDDAIARAVVESVDALPPVEVPTPEEVLLETKEAKLGEESAADRRERARALKGVVSECRELEGQMRTLREKKGTQHELSALYRDRDALDAKVRELLKEVAPEALKLVDMGDLRNHAYYRSVLEEAGVKTYAELVSLGKLSKEQAENAAAIQERRSAFVTRLSQLGVRRDIALRVFSNESQSLSDFNDVIDKFQSGDYDAFKSKVGRRVKYLYGISDESIAKQIADMEARKEVQIDEEPPLPLAPTTANVLAQAAAKDAGALEVALAEVEIEEAPLPPHESGAEVMSNAPHTSAEQGKENDVKFKKRIAEAERAWKDAWDTMDLDAGDNTEERETLQRALADARTRALASRTEESIAELVVASRNFANLLEAQQAAYLERKTAESTSRRPEAPAMAGETETEVVSTTSEKPILHETPPSQYARGPHYDFVPTTSPSRTPTPHTVRDDSRPEVAGTARQDDEDSSERVVGATEYSRADIETALAAGGGDTTPEKKGTAPKPKILTREVIGRFGEAGVGMEDLKEIPGFMELSEGQQLLVLKNYSSGLVREATTTAEANVNERYAMPKKGERGARSLAKFAGQTAWQIFTLGIKKNYDKKKEEKEILEKMISEETLSSEAKRMKLEALCRVFKEGGPSVEALSDGSVRINYMNAEEPRFAKNPEAAAVLERFNAAASEYAKTPLQWTIAEAALSRNPEEKRGYWKRLSEKKDRLMSGKEYFNVAEARERYAEEKLALARLLEESSGLPEGPERMKAVARELMLLEERVKQNQVFAECPNAEEALLNIKDGSVIGRAVRDFSVNRGQYLALGFVTRMATHGLTAGITLPLGEAIVGGVGTLQGKREAKEISKKRRMSGALSEQDMLEEISYTVDHTQVAQRAREAIHYIENRLSGVEAQQDPSYRAQLEKELVARKEELMEAGRNIANKAPLERRTRRFKEFRDASFYSGLIERYAAQYETAREMGDKEGEERIERQLAKTATMMRMLLSQGAVRFGAGGTDARAANEASDFFLALGHADTLTHLDDAKLGEKLEQLLENRWKYVNDEEKRREKKYVKTAVAWRMAFFAGGWGLGQWMSHGQHEAVSDHVSTGRGGYPEGTVPNGSHFVSGRGGYPEGHAPNGSHFVPGRGGYPEGSPNALHLATHEVARGETLTAIARKFPELKGLPSQEQNTMLAQFFNRLSPQQLHELGVKSGDADMIRVGEHIDMEKFHRMFAEMRGGGHLSEAAHHVHGAHSVATIHGNAPEPIPYASERIPGPEHVESFAVSDAHIHETASVHAESPVVAHHETPSTHTSDSHESVGAAPVHHETPTSHVQEAHGGTRIIPGKGGYPEGSTFTPIDRIEHDAHDAADRAYDGAIKSIFGKKGVWDGDHTSEWNGSPRSFGLGYKDRLAEEMLSRRGGVFGISAQRADLADYLNKLHDTTGISPNPGEKAGDYMRRMLLAEARSDAYRKFAEDTVARATMEAQHAASAVTEHPSAMEVAPRTPAVEAPHQASVPEVMHHVPVHVTEHVVEGVKHSYHSTQEALDDVMPKLKGLLVQPGDELPGVRENLIANFIRQAKPEHFDQMGFDGRAVYAALHGHADQAAIHEYYATHETTAGHVADAAMPRAPVAEATHHAPAHTMEHGVSTAEVVERHGREAITALIARESKGVDAEAFIKYARDLPSTVLNQPLDEIAKHVPKEFLPAIDAVQLDMLHRGFSAALGATSNEVSLFDYMAHGYALDVK